MKLKLNKKKLKNLSKDRKSLPAEMTPQIAGGGIFDELTVAGKIYTCTCVNW
jgi:hypothetical protein